MGTAKELSRGVQKLRLALCNLKLGWISSAWCNAGEQVQLCIASDSCPQICLKGELHHSVPSLQTGHSGATSPITAMTNEVREGTIGNVYLINCSFQLESSLFIIAMNKMHSFWSLATFLLPIIMPKLPCPCHCFARGRLKYTESLQKIALHWCQQNLLLSFLNTSRQRAAFKSKL